MEQHGKHKEMQQYLQSKLDDAKAYVGKEDKLYNLLLIEFYTEALQILGKSSDKSLLLKQCDRLYSSWTSWVRAEGETEKRKEFIRQQTEARAEAFAVIRNIADYLNGSWGRFPLPQTTKRPKQ